MHSMRGTTGACPRGGWRVDSSTWLQRLAAGRLSWSLGLRESRKTLLLLLDSLRGVGGATTSLAPRSWE